MAARRPLVRVGGQNVQLPAGDTLAGVGDFLKDGSVQMTGPLAYANQANVAVGSTTNIGAANSNYIRLIGGSGVSVTRFDASVDGAFRHIRLPAGVTLVNGAFLTLPGFSDIVTQEGDFALAFCSGGNTWRVIDYTRADGTALVSSGGSGPASTDALPEGSTNLYFTAVRVLGTALAGFASSVGAVTAADTILSALGKLEGTKAPLASPALTGTPTAPTAAAGTSTTQVSTTAFATGAANAAAAASVPLTSVGAANGVAPLGSDSKIAAAYLPSYVDDVLEFANLAAFPATGETGKIYIALDTNREYRWSGSIYVQLVASPGTTDNVPEGTTNLYFTAARVLGTALAGFASAVGAVSASDSILSAIGKLQGTKVDAVSGKGLSTNDYTTAEQTKLAGIATGATNNPDTGSLAEGTNLYFTQNRVRATLLTGLSVATGGVIAAADTVLQAFGKLQYQLSNLTKSNVGLANVDNTSDVNKPVSTAQQSALDTKVTKTGSETIAGVKTFSSSPIVPTVAGSDTSQAAASSAGVRAIMAQFGLGASDLQPLANADDMTLKPGWYITTASTTGTLPAVYGIVRSDSLAGGGSTNTWALYTFYATNGNIYTRFSINLAAWSPWRQQVFASGADFTGAVTFAAPLKLGQYTLTTLPSAATYSGYTIDVTNATGGVKQCRSNGANWIVVNTTNVVN